MVIKNLPQIGAPVLRERAKNLTLADLRNPQTKRVITNLVDTMRSESLVGMAAPQIGKSLRIFAIEVRPTKYRKLKVEPLMVYINPRINWKSKATAVEYEGCGSVGLFGPVRRHQSIKVEYDDIEGKRYKEKLAGEKAIIFQHELDHLNGILFTDLVTDNRKLLDHKAYMKYVEEKRKQQTKK